LVRLVSMEGRGRDASLAGDKFQRGKGRADNSKGIVQRRGLRPLAICIPPLPQDDETREKAKMSQPRSEDVFRRPARVDVMPQAFPERRAFPSQSARTDDLQPRPSKASRMANASKRPASYMHDAARPDIESPRPKTAAAGRSNSTGVSDGLWDEPVLVQAARNIYFLLLLLIDLCCRLGSALVLLPASLIRAVISPSPPWHCTTPTSLRAHSSQPILRPDTPTSSLGLCVEALFGSASPRIVPVDAAACRAYRDPGDRNRS